MGRIITAAGLLTLIAMPFVSASEYVPGQYRPDGIYVAPHFRGDGSVQAAGGWAEALRVEEAERRGKEPPPTAGPPAAAPGVTGRTAG